eukprot:TRINITY_DN9558_c0_g1_i1.p1 TRINITY_DN9558_c0_g1~~TRINITY_DN9558_c0_g1_i1.p1  ORF type:complete len:511 (-),score=109.72 TRINITY_DN9558_c0_g1_i1:159-1691(-)
MSSIKSLSFFSICVWSLCFLYSFTSLPENWKAKASWLLKEGEYNYDVLNLNRNERAFLSFVIANIICLTVFIGMLFHHIEKLYQPKNRTNNVNYNKQTIIGKCVNLLRNYSHIIVLTLIFGLSLYAWCVFSFHSESGLTYYYASKFFNDGNPFSKVTAGFFTSILLLSYLDPFDLRKYFGISVELVNSPSKNLMGVLALIGLGGMGGVFGTSVVILIDILQKIVYLVNRMNEDSILQPTWDYLRINHGEMLESQWFNILYPSLLYFSICVPFMLLDVCPYFEWSKKYKLQNPFAKPMSWKIIKPALVLTLWNQLIFIAPVSVLAIIFGPPIPLPETAPTLTMVIIKVILCLVLFDFLYWAWHMAFHKWKFGYKHVHSVHHKYKSVFSWVTQFVHPVELIFTALFAALCPIILFCHPITNWVWLFVNIYVSIDAHCGFDFPWALHNILPGYGGSKAHDMHHQRPLTNFEPFFTYLDKLFNTEAPEKYYNTGKQYYKPTNGNNNNNNKVAVK